MKKHHIFIHYGNVIMDAIASQITSLTIVYSIVYSDADQRKHQSSASLAFVRGIHQGPVNSPHKWPVTWKCFHLMTSSCAGGCPQPGWIATPSALLPAISCCPIAQRHPSLDGKWNSVARLLSTKLSGSCQMAQVGNVVSSMRSYRICNAS